MLKQGRMVVCERVEGTIGLDDLLARIQAAIADNEGELVVERTERARREEDQRLREAQDEAYQLSLAADREKERLRVEALEKEQAEVRQSQEQEREEQKKEEVSCPKKEKGKRVFDIGDVVIAFYGCRSLKLSVLCVLVVSQRSLRRPAPWQSRCFSGFTLDRGSREDSQRQTSWRYGLHNPLDLPQNCFIIASSFLPLQSVYDFAYTAERDQLPHKFILITNFPRRELHPSADGGPALGELGLGRKCVLFVHDVSD